MNTCIQIINIKEKNKEVSCRIKHTECGHLVSLKLFYVSIKNVQMKLISYFFRYDNFFINLLFQDVSLNPAVVTHSQQFLSG